VYMVRTGSGTVGYLPTKGTWEAYRESYIPSYLPWEAYREVYPPLHPPWEAYREEIYPSYTHPGRHI